MNDRDFDDLLARSKQLARVLALVYKDVTGEDFDLEGAVRHHPLVMLGAAAGLGFLAGQWMSRRSHQELPPPPDARSRENVRHLLPESLEQVRRLLPEWSAQDAEVQARVWVERVLDPRVREGLESTKFGAFLRRTFEGLGEEDDEGGGQAEEP